ncbi:MAG: hypothetical protein AAF805_14215 [Planctomycetota bacterium]
MAPIDRPSEIAFPAILPYGIGVSGGGGERNFGLTATSLTPRGKA